MRLDLFALKPVEDDRGYFDDIPNPHQSLWGSYLTVPAPIASRGQADIYYIGLDTQPATYNRGTANDFRNTIGFRAFRPTGKGLDYNWEPDYQWGSFGSSSIRAWSVSTETGFTLDRTPFHPRPLLRADVYSGDGNYNGVTTANSLSQVITKAGTTTSTVSSSNSSPVYGQSFTLSATVTSAGGGQRSRRKRS